MFLAILFVSNSYSANIITAFGLPGCIELKNDEVRVVLDPNVGGRVLYYEKNGKNILYLNPDHKGIKDGMQIKRIDAGRFDFGPTKVIPKRDLYFKGKWQAEITGEFSVRMISQVDPAHGIKIVREFVLDKNSSHLSCKQTLINVGNEIKHLMFWSRTFVHGGGICLVPVKPHSRFPDGYIGYRGTDNGPVMVFSNKNEPNIRVRENVLETLGENKFGKLVMDGEEGWMAYLSPKDLLFIKKFNIYPDKKYGEMTAATTSVWQYKDEIYELEPYGPLEAIEPGRSASFTEHWFLRDYAFPENYKADLSAIKSLISTLP